MPEPRKRPPRCANCGAVIRGYTEHKLVAAAQSRDLDQPGDDLAGGWSTTEYFGESEFIAYYVTACCDRVIPEADLAVLGILAPDDLAAAIIPPMPHQIGRPNR